MYTTRTRDDGFVPPFRMRKRFGLARDRSLIGLPCGIRGVQHKAVFKTLSDIKIEQLQGISGPDREGLASYQVD